MERESSNLISTFSALWHRVASWIPKEEETEFAVADMGIQEADGM